VHNDTSPAGLHSAGEGVEAVAPHRVPVRERMIVEQDPVTGVRLKYYSQAADVEYWTDLWK
jgi:hypothetical protein